MSSIVRSARLALAVLAATASVETALASEELAKQLNNPVADLISFPIQSNYDFNIGPDNGWRSTNNVQPVIPISITEDWNLISRTIVPVIYQNDIFPGEGAQFGLSDTLQSLFFSPKAPLPTPVGNLIWGAGPAIELPTSTDRLLGGGYFSLGPTGVALIQKGPWTYGALVNHVWGVAEARDNLPDANRTYMQPFIAYTTKSAWTFSLNSELTYDWTGEELSGPINLGIAKVTEIGGQPIQFTGRLRWWAADTRTSPSDLGFTFQVNFLFPKGS
jgi:hypothetical protein